MIEASKSKSPPLLAATGIVKRYGHVTALRGADFSVNQGEVVALVGDNGAGKSTLVKVLSGTLQPDEGDILLDGHKVKFPSAIDARNMGIETVYQDLALAEDLDTPANLFLGRELHYSGLLGRLGIINKRAMLRQARTIFERLEIVPGDMTRPVVTLSGGQKQAVAVARTTAWARKLIIMDEPTAALGHLQTSKVLDLIRRTRDQGTTVILVSHNLPEVLSIADRLEVFRLGRRVAQFRASGTTIEDVILAITGGLEYDRP